MDSLLISPYAILHLLQAQPDLFLDCSFLPVTVFVPDQNAHLAVSSLRLLTYPHSLTEELEYLIEVLFQQDGQTIRPSLFLSSNNLKSTFRIQANDPILQKMPTTPLFPPNHPLHTTRQIPISPMYTCTIEETRQLLAHNIPDLPLETFQYWTTPLKIAVRLTWPSPASLSYIAQSFPHESYTLEQQGLLTNPGDPTKTPPSEFAYQCYAFRNTIALNAIFPHLASLCAWAASPAPSEPLQNISMLTTPLLGLRTTHLLAFPTLPPQADLNSANVQEYPYLRMSDYFPPPDFKSQTYDPKSPQSSPAEVLHRILNDIENIQLAALSC